MLTASTDGMFRELNKVNTPLADKWRKAALLLSYLSVLVTLSLGVTYFGKFFTYYLSARNFL